MCVCVCVCIIHTHIYIYIQEKQRLNQQQQKIRQTSNQKFGHAVLRPSPASLTCPGEEECPVSNAKDQAMHQPINALSTVLVFFA